MAEYRGLESWPERLLGWIFTLLVVAVLAQALVELVRPMLPWIGLGLVLAVATRLWISQRRRW